MSKLRYTHQRSKPLRTDSDVMGAAKRIEDALWRAYDVLDTLRESEHPNAPAIVQAILEQQVVGVVPDIPSVVRSHLLRPARHG